MKTLVVLENNCGGEGQGYRRWLIKNLPDDIKLDFRENCSGVGGGMRDDENNEIEGAVEWWATYCMGGEKR